MGPAGQALRHMMREAGVDASLVRLANSIPFRPIDRSKEGRYRNRRPAMQELETYGRLILADSASVRPRLIGAGKIGGCTIRRSDARRAGPGRCFEFQGIPVRVTYHPA